jgi:hypothetical protein
VWHFCPIEKLLLTLTGERSIMELERANEVTQKNILHIRVMTELTIDEEQKCTKLF